MVFSRGLHRKLLTLLSLSLISLPLPSPAAHAPEGDESSNPEAPGTTQPYRCGVKVTVTQSGWQVPQGSTRDWQAYLRYGTGSGKIKGEIERPLERTETLEIVGYALANELDPEKLAYRRMQAQIDSMREELKDPGLNSVRTIVSTTLDIPVERPISRTNLSERKSITVSVKTAKSEITQSDATIKKGVSCSQAKDDFELRNEMLKDWLSRADSRKRYARANNPDWKQNMFAADTLLEQIREMTPPKPAGLVCYAIDLPRVPHLTPEFWQAKQRAKSSDAVSEIKAKWDDSIAILSRANLQSGEVQLAAGETAATARNRSCAALVPKLGKAANPRCHCNADPIPQQQIPAAFLIGNFSFP